METLAQDAYGVRHSIPSLYKQHLHIKTGTRLSIFTQLDCCESAHMEAKSTPLHCWWACCPLILSALPWFPCNLLYFPFRSRSSTERLAMGIIIFADTFLGIWKISFRRIWWAKIFLNECTHQKWCLLTYMFPPCNEHKNVGDIFCPHCRAETDEWLHMGFGAYTHCENVFGHPILLSKISQIPRKESLKK